MSIKDKETAEYIKKHEFFLEKQKVAQLYLCPYNLGIYEALKDFLQGDNSILLLSGEGGMGKTHLINFFLAEGRANSLYIDTSDFIETIYKHSRAREPLKDFLDWILTHDLIVFDSYQLSRGKDKVEEAFSAMERGLNGAKLLFIWTEGGTAPKPPQNHPILHLPTPNHESLRQIATQFLEANHPTLRLNGQALDLIIDSIPPNVKLLLDKLSKLALFYIGDVGKEEKMRDVLRGFTREENRHSDRALQYAHRICQRLEMDAEEIFSDSRNRDTVWRRNVLIFLLKRFTPLSHKEIGELFNKNHSTVSHSIQEVEKKLDNRYFREYLKKFL